jgi:hypothetical protein
MVCAKCLIIVFDAHHKGTESTKLEKMTYLNRFTFVTLWLKFVPYVRHHGANFGGLE